MTTAATAAGRTRAVGEDDEATATELPEHAADTSDPESTDDELAPEQPAEPEHKGWPKGKKRGKCQECGNDADTPQGTWCAVHRPVRRDSRPKPRPKSQRPSSPREPRSTAIATTIRTQLEFVAQLWAIRDPVCAQALLDQAKPMADYWAGRARESDRVARVLEGVVSSSGWLGALSVHAPFALTVWTHHVAPAIAARNEPPDDGYPDEAPAEPWNPSSLVDDDEGTARPWEIRDDAARDRATG